MAANAIACSNNFGTAANTYYRVFDLPALGITTDFTVNTVSFQVEDCESIGGDGAPVAVRVGTYGATPTGTLNPAKITILASNNSVQVPEVVEDLDTPSTPGGTVNAPISAVIPANNKLIIEVDAPDGSAQGSGEYFFFMGSTTAGETGTSYFSAPDCTPTPSSISAVAGHEVDLLMTVTGTF